jgi:FAD/FMN-containing dehydrogenase
MTEHVLRALRAAVKGAVSGPPLPPELCADHGNYRRAVPDVVVHAVCEDDVRAVLRVSRELGIRVTVRGTGHSSNGRLAIAAGGILLVNSTAGEVDVDISANVADIAARMPWRAVETRLNHASLAARVLPDTLTLSVGGTMSVGGYGAASVRWGAQVDSVESIRLILPDGTPVECSRDDNSELFRLALGGLGAVGVIERVRVQTKPMPCCSRAYVSTTRTWRAALDVVGEIVCLPEGETLQDLPMELAASFDARGGALLRRRYYFATAEAAGEASGSRLPFMTATAGPVERASAFSEADAIDAWMSGFTRTRKVWADYLLDFPQFCVFMTEIERRLKGGHPGHRYLPSVYVLAVRIPASSGAGGFAGASALAPTAGAAGPYRFGCGLYHMVPEDDEGSLAAAVAACEELVRRCIDLGGRPYLHGVATMSEEVRHQVYGEDYRSLLRARRQHDRDGLFNAGWFQ